jgi:hypothetical protein
MRVINSDRSVIYKILALYFARLKKRPRIAELGVLRGVNSEVMRNSLKPVKMYLVDRWSPEVMIGHELTDYPKFWAVSHGDPGVERYYGGSLSDPLTYDKLYEETLFRFQNCSDVEIIRKNTSAAFDDLVRLGELKQLDLVYLDANHEYETVFWELMTYSALLSDVGFFQLNDCSHSQKGLEQNLGVLEAVVKFCKVSNFKPAILTNCDWSDVLLIRDDPSIVREVNDILESSSLSFIEVPDQLLGAARVIGKVKRNISFA